MSAQDKTEQVLREMHIMYANSEVYDKATNRVIIDKKEALNLLQRLNVCIYELMEEHELTQQSRDAAERQFRKKTDGIVEDANRMAEDVYAGSVMYTDEALHRVQDIMQDAMDSVREICDKMNDALAQEKSNVRRDQSELKSHLEDLRDTNKYMNLIEQRNKEIAKERAKREQEEEEATSVYASVKPEIKINEEYFEKNGIPLETEEPEEEPDDRNPLQERIKATGLVTSARSGNEVVPLSANYFILLLSGVGGRVMIRRYEHGRYEELCERIRQWYADLRLRDLGGAGYTKPFKLTARLIRLLKRQKGNDDVMKRLSKELAGITPAVLTAILTGAQFPEAVLMRALAYIRSQMLDSDENNIQIPEAIACQWLKAWLCRKERMQGEVATMPFVNPEHPNRAYHLGRMVAVYARIQQAALGKVNAGVVERYYASASQTPALVLGQLDKLANHHLAKIDNPAAAKSLSGELETISVAVGGNIPVTLTLEEQAYFALGYRQQCAEMNRRRNEAAAARKERSSNAPGRETAKEE